MLDVRIFIPKHPFLNIEMEMRSSKMPCCPRVGDVISIESDFFVVTQVMWVELFHTWAVNLTVDWME